MQPKFHAVVGCAAFFSLRIAPARRFERAATRRCVRRSVTATTIWPTGTSEWRYPNRRSAPATFTTRPVGRREVDRLRRTARSRRSVRPRSSRSLRRPGQGCRRAPRGPRGPPSVVFEISPERRRPGARGHGRSTDSTRLSRTGWITTPSTAASVTSRLLPPPRIRHGRPRRADLPEDLRRLLGALGLDEETRRSSDPDRRVVREADVAAHAIGERLQHWPERIPPTGRDARSASGS